MGTAPFSCRKEPEELVIAKMASNPFWPFKEMSNKVYQLKTRRVKFYYALVLILVNTLGVLYLLFVTEERDVVVINVVIYIVLIYQICNYYNERTYVLLSDRKLYQFYIGDKLAKESHLHNIYIRLSKQIASDERVLVKLVLYGYGIEQYDLSKNSSNYSAMRSIGMRIARRLDINFFDIQDTSRLHKIRHRCPHKYSMTMLNQQNMMTKERTSTDYPQLPNSTQLPDIVVGSQTS